MDPMTFGTDLRKQMETFFVTGMEHMLRSGETLQNVGKAMEVGLEGKRVADGHMKQYLEMMNVPTRDDVASILGYLQRIESKLLDLEEKVEDMTDLARQASTSPAAPPHVEAPMPAQKPAPSPAKIVAEPTAKAASEKTAPVKTAAKTKPVAQSVAKAKPVAKAVEPARSTKKGTGRGRK